MNLSASWRLAPFTILAALAASLIAFAPAASAKMPEPICAKQAAAGKDKKFCPAPQPPIDPVPVSSPFTASAGSSYTIIIERPAGGLSAIDEVDFWWTGVPDGYSNSTGIPRGQTDMVVEWTDTRIVVRFYDFYGGTQIRKIALRDADVGWLYGETGEVDGGVNFPVPLVIGA
jgi:hypothetical protein